MQKEELKSIIEALIFVSEEPISLDVITMVFGEAGVEKKEALEAFEELKAECNNTVERGIRIVEVAGGYQFRTKPSCTEWVQRLNVPKPVRLSQPALETLAVIAYRQPTLRSDIEQVRGVDCGGVLKTLLEKGLIRIIGKSDEPGCPLVYGTTKAFLEMFSLNSLKELPALREMAGLEARERVGGLGREEDGDEGGVADGVGEVVAEYKGGIDAYKVDPLKAEEDAKAVTDLDDSMKKLRQLEKDIFPKPVEQIQAVPKETGTEADETPAPQDSGDVDGTLPEER